MMFAMLLVELAISYKLACFGHPLLC
uniref:Uncharacterized protein n=1 Tax=Rhizophora mucronata TaxID=61149 RepID=A0A2P2NZ87_RHIMU